MVQTKEHSAPRVNELQDDLKKDTLPLDDEIKKRKEIRGRGTKQKMRKKELGILDSDILRQEGVCQAISYLLKNRIVFFGKAKNLEEYETLLSNNAFDIIIVISPDNLPWLYSAFDMTKRLSPRTRLIGIVGSVPDSQLNTLIKSGIKGIVNRSSGLQGILVAIEAIEHDKNYIDPSILTLARVTQMIQQPVIVLTEREKDILKPLAKGWRNQEIADYLSLETNTVKSHLQRIYKKFLARTRQEAIHYALINGFISLDDEDNEGIRQ